MNNNFIILLLAFALIFSGCKKKHAPTQFPALSSDTFALVFLSNLEGYVAPCGCTSNPLGGIDRFAQIYLDLKKATNNNIDLIDTGNLLFDSPTRHAADLCQDKARLDLLLSSLSNLGLKKTLVAGFDNARGHNFRQEFYDKYKINIFDTSNIINNTGIIIINNNTKQEIINLTNKLKEQKNIKAIIAISDLTRDETKKICENIKNLDLVIQAKTNSMTPTTPARLGENGPLLLEGGRQGQFANILIFQNLKQRTEQNLELDNRLSALTEKLELVTARLSALKAQKEKATPERKEFLTQRIKLAQQELTQLGQQKKQINKPLDKPHIIFESIAITKKINPEPEIKNNLEEYEKKIPALVAQCEANIECPKAKPHEATYVGAQTCKSCHAQAYEVWQKAIVTSTGKNEEGKEYTRVVGHSKAWKTLVDVNKDQDRSCIGCHSIGFMKPGGYCKARDVDFRKDVQCESCHGPGSLHAQSGNKKYITGKPTEETCRNCHHVPHISGYDSFNYDRDVMKILGPGHGEKLLQELKHKAR